MRSSGELLFVMMSALACSSAPSPQMETGTLGAGGTQNQAGGANVGGNSAGSPGVTMGGASQAVAGAGGTVASSGASGEGGGLTEGGAGGSLGSAGAAGEASAGAAGAPAVIECDLELEGEGADLFSSFVISYEALQREASEQGLPNPELGLGGNLGGLAGADAICQRAAEYSTVCAQNKTWRAFLSTSTVDAIDRVGNGPWHDRLGRKIADTRADLLNERPNGIDPAIATDWPNEFGVLNQNPDNEGPVDNHEILTGSGEDGRLYSQEGTGNYGAPNGCNDFQWTEEHATCNDWTSAEEEGCPRVGHSWYNGEGGSGRHWISVWNEGGCARGVNLIQMGGIQMDNKTVGSAGGYGGFYCFAVTGE